MHPSPLRHLRQLTTWAACSTLFAASAMTQGAAFVHPDGTTHRYQMVVVPNGINWSDANRAANAAGGYLATITSAAEQAFVFQNLGNLNLWKQDTTSGRWYGPWLGGVQPTGSLEPIGGWSWSELESYTYAAWASGEPNNTGSFSAAAGDRIMIGGELQIASAWADANSSELAAGYIIEYAHQTAPTTVGLVKHEALANQGYTLFAPFNSRTTFLVDNRGRVVKTWLSSYPTGQSVYLLENGNLLRCGGTRNPAAPAAGDGGVVEEFDWDGNLVWRYFVSTPDEVQHHDIARMANGNTLMLIWDRKTAAESIAAGRNPNKLSEGELWPCKIIEVQRTGTFTGQVVWEWHPFDHLIQDFDSTKANFGNVGQHPELIDINYTLTASGIGDWMHSNAIDYNEQLDQIVISLRSFDEMWVLDHSTTPAEAKGHTGGRAGKGGDILFRWGNPRAYRAGTVADQRLFKQHDVQWIKPGLPGAGNFLVFNNGTDRPAGNYSTADEIVSIVDATGNYPRTGSKWGPDRPIWSYVPPDRTAFYSQFVSGVQRLKNGHTMVCAGFLGRTREVTASNNETVWEYVNPITPTLSSQGQQTRPAERGMFRSPHYAPDYPAFRGRKLTPGEPLEVHDSALLVEGSTVPARIQNGSSAKFSLRAIDHRVQAYFLATSATTGLIPIDNRFARMGYDSLLEASLLGSAPSIFQGYTGTLDSQGRGTAHLAVPAMPALQGLKVYTTMFVVRPNSPSTVGFISNTVEIEIR